MTNEYRYILEKRSKKHHCPECGKKRFVRFVDLETGEFLPFEFGRCDRESNCQYFLDPYKSGYAKMIWNKEHGINTVNYKPSQKKYRPIPKLKSSFIPVEVLIQTMKGYLENKFIQNLFKYIHFPFDAEPLNKIISLYHLGTVTTGYMKGAITFPFIDIDFNIRAIQVKQFNKMYNHTTGQTYLHSLIEKNYFDKNKSLPEWLSAYQKQEKKVSCLFGEHLLNLYPKNPVAIVEAPKTAIYGTLYFGMPNNSTNLLWLAVGALSYLNYDRCKVLRNRNVVLFPDLSEKGNAYQFWIERAKQFNEMIPGAIFTHSDLLERNANDQHRKKGLDLADYIIKQDWRDFIRS